jgi:regulator of extracellular matrix RemA (YlzA/DUF370 family)
MPNMLILGRGGSLNPERIVAIASLESAPIKRLLQATGDDRLLNLTYGYPRRSVVIFDNGMMVITHRTVAELTKAVHFGEGLDHDSPPWW